MREVPFVSSDDRTIEHHWRNDIGTWVLRDLGGHDAIALPSIEVTLAAEDLFARLEHEAPTAPWI